MLTITDRIKQDASGLYAEKKPQEQLTYAFLFKKSLAPGALLISASADFASGVTVSAQVNASSFVLNNETNPVGTAALFHISGGTSGVTYAGTVTVTTDETPAQVESVDFRIRIL